MRVVESGLVCSMSHKGKQTPASGGAFPRSQMPVLTPLDLGRRGHLGGIKLERKFGSEAIAAEMDNAQHEMEFLKLQLEIERERRLAEKEKWILKGICGSRSCK